MPPSRCSRRPDGRHARSTALASAPSRHACGGFPPVTVPLPAAPHRGSHTCHPACTDDDEAPEILAEHREERGAPCGCSQMNAALGPISGAWELPHDPARRPAMIRPAMTLPEAVETTHVHRIAGRTGGRTAVITMRPCCALTTAPRMWDGSVGVSADARRRVAGRLRAAMREQAAGMSSLRAKACAHPRIPSRASLSSSPWRPWTNVPREGLVANRGALRAAADARGHTYPRGPTWCPRGACSAPPRGEASGPGQRSHTW
jgi:hypothetical protein